MKIVSKKLRREKKTLEKMINIYCQDNHNQERVRCAQCEELYQYASERLAKCILGNKKTTCAKCPVHCFKTEYKEMIKKVMRYSGPKMIYKHPLLAIYHLIDSHSKP